MSPLVGLAPALLAILVLLVVQLAPTPASAGEVIPLDGKTCPSMHDVVQLNNFSVYRTGNAFRASLELVVPRAVPVISKVAVKMTQCPTGDPCKPFYTMRFNAGICALLADKNAFWGPIFLGADPPMRCPLEKRKHIVRNATIAMDKFGALFNVAGPKVTREAIWTAKLDAWDEKAKMLACVLIKIKYTGGPLV